MKTRKIVLTLSMLLIPVLFAFSDGPGGPGGGSGGSGGPSGFGGIPVGNNAPIDGGFSLMLLLSAGFGYQKLRQEKKAI